MTDMVAVPCHCLSRMPIILSLVSVLQVFFNKITHMFKKNKNIFLMDASDIEDYLEMKFIFMKASFGRTKG